MEIVSLLNHTVRKALQLSLAEMAILYDIKKMSQHPKYGHQCVKSKDKIAEWLDLSRATVFRGIDTLELKGYIERTSKGLKPTQFIYDLDSAQEEIGIYIKNNNVELISAKMKELFPQSQNDTTTVSKCDGDSLKMILPQYQNDTQVYNINSKKKKNKNNISSHSSDKDILLEEKQTNIVFETTNDLVSESLTKNIDGNCTLQSQDSTKQSLPQEKNYKYLQNKDKFDFIREKTKYWNDNSPESARIKSGKKGEKGNDWCLKKLYEMVGKEKAEVVFDSVMSMPNRKPFYLVSSDILQQTLATYQDPNQETPKYLSNNLYERQSRYKGGDIPDDKMISSEATFYASLEWHFSDRYEGAELVKKVREFIKENNCKYKNY